MDRYAKQWQKAQQSDIFKEEPVVQQESEYFDEFDEFDQDCEYRDIDAEYWHQTYRNALADPVDSEEEEGGHDPSMTGDDEVVIQEGDEEWEDDGGVPVSKVDKNFSQEKEYSPNPIYRDSRGKDQRPHVTPNWTFGKELRELSEMKVSLEKLESKMNAADAFAKSKEAAKVKKQIDELWQKIDALSDKLTPDFITGYMS